MNAPLAPAPLAELRRVTVRRGGQVALHEVSLTIAQEEHIAILGPNGSGKSTLIKTICQECYPLPNESSSVAVFGQTRWNTTELRKLLGMVANEAGISATSARRITGREAVLSGFFSSIGLWPHHQVTDSMQARADEVLRLLQAEHLEDRKIAEMSSGEIRRMWIARALVHDPRALVFDEPSNSLDLFAQEELRQSMRLLAQSGVTILLVTHHLADIIPEIKRVVVMSQGRIVADGPKRELLTSEHLTRLFRVRVEVAMRDGYYHAW